MCLNMIVDGTTLSKHAVLVMLRCNRLETLCHEGYLYGSFVTRCVPHGAF